MPTQSRSNGQSVFGSLLAVALLILYSSILIYMMINAVSCESAEVCRALIDDKQGMIYVVTTIGGLISALVIAELAVTPAGETPVAYRMAPPANIQQAPQRIERIKRGAVATLTYAYLIVWVLLGLAALVIGVVLYPEASMTIRALGNTWLGLAVAAGYSYFGIKN